eukprot:3770304-Heterocapsa_arctica.AAC.1
MSLSAAASCVLSQRTLDVFCLCCGELCALATHYTSIVWPLRAYSLDDCVPRGDSRLELPSLRLSAICTGTMSQTVTQACKTRYVSAG